MGCCNVKPLSSGGQNRQFETAGSIYGHSYSTSDRHITSMEWVDRYAFANLVSTGSDQAIYTWQKRKSRTLQPQNSAAGLKALKSYGLSALLKHALTR